MRSIILTLSALALSSSVVFAQTPPAPPPAGGAPTAEQPMAPPPPPPPASTEPGAVAPPPPNAEAVDDDMVDGPEGGPAMHGKPGGPDHKMMGHGGPRHHMRPGGRGDRQWRGMRRARGPEFKIEIDDDGGIKIEVKCGPREEARACADITMELMDRAMN